MDLNAIALGLSAALVSLAVAAATVFRSILDEWGQRCVRRMRAADKRYAMGLGEVAQFHSVCERIQALPYVGEVLLFEGRNGGGVPRAGKPYTTACLHGWSTDPKKHPERVYDSRFRVDAHYVDTLRRTLEQGRVELATEELPADSMVRAFHAEEGIASASWYLLRLDPDSGVMLYASVASYAAPFTDRERLQVMLMIGRLRALLDAGTDPGADPETPAPR